MEAYFKKMESQVITFWRELFGKYRDSKECTLLEIGCGQGELGLILSGNVVKKYYGIDPDNKRIEYAKEKAKGKEDIEYQVGKAEQIPFKKKFDILFYTFSWHFIKNFDDAIKEALRVLTQDGILAILEPNEKKNKWKSPVLTRGTSEFSEAEHKKKLQDLKRGKEALYAQKEFIIVEERIGDENKPNIWILKRTGK